jgi:DNA-binding MarR family transcriptional regulator
MTAKPMPDEDDDIPFPVLDDAARAVLPHADTVRRAVTHMARRLRSLRHDREISGAKLSLLARLHRANRPLVAADIARTEGLQPQSLTRLIAELDARGLIARSQDDFDRRQILIEITPQGRRHLRSDAIQQNLWLAKAMTSALTKPECELLRIAAELLDRLADAEGIDAPSGGDEG